MRVGVVGVGAMGRLHARAYTELGDCELVGVHDIDPDRSREVAARHQVESFSDLDSLLGRVDAVTVAVPTPDHDAVGVRCLAAGCDVLIEKPIAASLDQADRLIAAAEKGGRILQVGHIERYNPAVEKMVELVESPGFIEVDRLGSLVPRSLETDVVLDLMIHDIDIVHWLVDDEVVEIRAVGVPILTEAIDFANARLEFAGGCIANLTASRVSVNRIRKVRVFQPEGYLSVDYTAQVVEHYRLLRADGRPSGIETDRFEASGDEPLLGQLKDFARACAERIRPLADGQSARRALATALNILDAIDARMR
jgi:predicted dehydrogenase